MRRTQIRGHMRPIWFFWLCFVCFGQHVNKVDIGTITGRIVDEFGDPVSGAAVSATGSAGQEFHATTLGNGSYTIDKLVPGRYEITATMNAMKKYDAKGFIVEGGKPLRLDIKMVQPEGYLGTLGEEDRFTASSFARIGQKPVPVGPAPRLPDGKPDFSGFWWADRPAEPLEPPRPQPRADALRQERQRNNMRDLPSGHCLPGGIVDPAGRGRFVHTSQLLVMLIGPPVVSTYFEVRQIFLDGRMHPRDVNPTWMGHSAGHWEGDTLVIDTVGFNALAWYGGGLSSTESLHVTERYWRPDMGHLELEITVDDPAVLEKPWIQKRTSHLVPDEDIEEYVCAENNKDVEHLK